MVHMRCHFIVIWMDFTFVITFYKLIQIRNFNMWQHKISSKSSQLITPQTTLIIKQTNAAVYTMYQSKTFDNKSFVTSECGLWRNISWYHFKMGELLRRVVKVEIVCVTAIDYKLLQASQHNAPLVVREKPADASIKFLRDQGLAHERLHLIY